MLAPAVTSAIRVYISCHPTHMFWANMYEENVSFDILISLGEFYLYFCSVDRSPEIISSAIFVGKSGKSLDEVHYWRCWLPNHCEYLWHSVVGPYVRHKSAHDCTLCLTKSCSEQVDSYSDVSKKSQVCLQNKPHAPTKLLHWFPSEWSTSGTDSQP